MIEIWNFMLQKEIMILSLKIGPQHIIDLFIIITSLIYDSMLLHRLLMNYFYFNGL